MDELEMVKYVGLSDPHFRTGEVDNGSKREFCYLLFSEGKSGRDRDVHILFGRLQLVRAISMRLFSVRCQASPKEEKT